MENKNVLILTSDRLSQKSLFELLSRSGYKVDIADSLESAIAYLEEKPHRIALADIDGRSEGLKLLKFVKDRSHPAEVIIVASCVNLDIALNSVVKMGALDYLIKPVEDGEIIAAIERALTRAENIKQYNPPAGAKKAAPEEKDFHGLLGMSPGMKEIYSIIDRVSNSKTTILLRGESGTGKRMIARAIHEADKKRKDKPFVEISCGALPKEIVESELFGHKKGAFTGAVNDRLGRFELANGGTLLLDDIDSFSLDLQVKLLRVLQQKEFERVGDHKTIKVDVRVIATTNQDIDKLVVEKNFREDLFWRLNVISLNIPPLRSRKEDLPNLVNHFVDVFARENHKNITGIAGHIFDILTRYDWPGNIRELENILERAVILDTDSIIDKDDLPDIILRSVQPIQAAALDAAGDLSSLKDALKEPEKVYILQVMQEVGWNKKKAANKLGVNRTTLYNKLRKYNLISAVSEK